MAGSKDSVFERESELPVLLLHREKYYNSQNVILTLCQINSLRIDFFG